MLVKEGNIVDGKVSVITDFGAFIELPEGKTGLLHISEVASRYVKDIRSYLTENQNVKVKILSIDQKGKISLSIKKALDMPLPKENKKDIKKDVDENKVNVSEDTLFEDRLAKFMKDSDERLHYLKNSFESRRNGRRSGGSKKTSKY